MEKFIDEALQRFNISHLKDNLELHPKDDLTRCHYSVKSDKIDVSFEHEPTLYPILAHHVAATIKKYPTVEHLALREEKLMNVTLSAMLLNNSLSLLKNSRPNSRPWPLFLSNCALIAMIANNKKLMMIGTQYSALVSAIDKLIEYNDFVPIGCAFLNSNRNLVRSALFFNGYHVRQRMEEDGLYLNFCPIFHPSMNVCVKFQQKF